jgi:NADH-quinone oxidoreductase subunit G
LQVNVIHAVDDDLLMRVANKAIVPPSQFARALAQVVKAVAQEKNAALPPELASIEPDDAAQRIAQSLTSGKNAAIFLGNFAQHHPAGAQLHALVQALADLTGARFGFLGEAANSVGGYIAGAAGGTSARELIAKPHQAYVLLGVEPELD